MDQSIDPGNNVIVTPDIKPGINKDFENSNAPSSIDIDNSKDAAKSKIMTTPTQPQSGNWSGVWNSDFGKVTFKQDGTKFTGSYGDDASKIEGTVSGSKFTGKFEEYGQTGEVEFVLKSDGSSFTGQWRYIGDTIWSQWNGTKSN